MVTIDTLELINRRERQILVHSCLYYHDKTLEIEGDDGYGNGYYGGGFWVTIEKEELE